MTPSGARWTGKVGLIRSKLQEPLGWRKPERIFVNSMSDLFHEEVGADAIQSIFDVMFQAPRHTFMILTKRAKRMAEKMPHIRFPGGMKWEDKPAPHILLGVSVENQEAANERVPLLLQTPAAVRFLSVEPLLGPVDLSPWLEDPCDCLVPALEGAGQHSPGCRTFRVPWGIDWVIVGAESGPRARPMEEDWVRLLRDQAARTRTRFFFKQAIRDGKKVSLPELDGRRWAEFPSVGANR